MKTTLVGTYFHKNLEIGVRFHLATHRRKMDFVLLVGLVQRYLGVPQSRSLPLAYFRLQVILNPLALS
jgi:hypothetical protein